MTYDIPAKFYAIFLMTFKKFIKNASPDERMIVSDISSEPSKIFIGWFT